jgi:FAD synthase
VTFIAYVRGDIKFNSLDALKDQLAVDRDTVDRILSNNQ